MVWNSSKLTCQSIEMNGSPTAEVAEYLLRGSGFVQGTLLFFVRPDRPIGRDMAHDGIAPLNLRVTPSTITFNLALPCLEGDFHAVLIMPYGVDAEQGRGPSMDVFENVLSISCNGRLRSCT